MRESFSPRRVGYAIAGMAVMGLGFAVAAVSDVEVSSNGKVVMFSAEGGTNSGLYFYSLTNPAHPTFLAYYPVSAGLHTATFGYINGNVYAFAARNPGSPALMIWDVTNLVQ